MYDDPVHSGLTTVSQFLPSIFISAATITILNISIKETVGNFSVHYSKPKTITLEKQWTHACQTKQM